jgi:hypothetical protein
MTAWLLVGVFVASETLSVRYTHNLDRTTCPRELINHVLNHRYVYCAFAVIASALWTCKQRTLAPATMSAGVV